MWLIKYSTNELVPQ